MWAVFERIFLWFIRFSKLLNEQINRDAVEKVKISLRANERLHYVLMKCLKFKTKNYLLIYSFNKITQNDQKHEEYEQKKHVEHNKNLNCFKNEEESERKTTDT